MLLRMAPPAAEFVQAPEPLVRVRPNYEPPIAKQDFPGAWKYSNLDPGKFVREQLMIEQSRLKNRVAWRKEPLVGQKLVVRSPRSIDLSSISLEPQQFPPVVERALRLLRAYPNDLQLLNEVGVMFAKLGRFAEAESYFNAILAKVPDSRQALFNLALAANNSGNRGRSVELLQRILQLWPRDLGASCGMAFIYLDAKQNRKAAEILRRALDAAKPDKKSDEPHLLHARVLLTILYSDLGERVEARRFADEAIREHGTEVPPHLMAASVAIEDGRLEDARMELDWLRRHESAIRGNRYYLKQWSEIEDIFSTADFEAQLAMLRDKKGGAFASSAERLRELSELKDGWLGPGGKHLSAQGLAWFVRVYAKVIIGSGLPTPHLFPTPEGNIQAEWSLGSWSVEAEFDHAAHHASLLAVSKKNAGAKDVELNLDSPSVGSEFSRFFDSLVTGG